MTLAEKYQDMVKQRDTLRIKYDAEGLSAEEILELKTVSQDFLDYRTLRAAEEQVRVAEIRKKISPFKRIFPNISWRSEHDHFRYGRVHQK